MFGKTKGIDTVYGVGGKTYPFDEWVMVTMRKWIDIAKSARDQVEKDGELLSLHEENNAVVRERLNNHITLINAQTEIGLKVVNVVSMLSDRLDALTERVDALTVRKSPAKNGKVERVEKVGKGRVKA
jgi:hypothetical protein